MFRYLFDFADSPLLVIEVDDGGQLIARTPPGSKTRFFRLQATPERGGAAQ